MKRCLIAVIAVQCVLIVFLTTPPLSASTRQEAESIQAVPIETRPVSDHAESAEPQTVRTGRLDAVRRQRSMSIGLAYHATLDILQKPEVAEQMATYTWNYYKALTKKGSSKDEALEIVARHGHPFSLKSADNK